MKQWKIVCLLLLVACNANAMDLDEAELLGKNNEKCMRVACYLKFTANRPDKNNEVEQEKRKKFLSSHANAPKVLEYMSTLDADRTDAWNFLCSTPDVITGDLHEKINKLQPNVALMATILSGFRGKTETWNQPAVLFVSYNRDIFTALCTSQLPDFFEDKAGFFNSSFNQGVQKVDKHFVMPGHAPLPNKNAIDKRVSKDFMIKALEKMPFEQALYSFQYVSLPPSPDSESRFNRQEITDSFVKVRGHSYTDGHEYHWTYKDCKRFTDKQRRILDEIVKKDNAIPAQCFRIQEEDIALMKQKKEGAPKEDTLTYFVLHNAKYKDARINVELPSRTIAEMVKDKLLIWMPYGIVSIMPDLILSQTNGKLQGAAGVLALGLGCAAIGEFFYPKIDYKYHSKVQHLSPWFGPDNHAPKKKGSALFGLSVVHALSTVIMQKLWSWHRLPWKIASGVVCLFRLGLLYCVSTESERTANYYRYNKGGYAFTLEDLMNGPKFAE